MQAVDEQKPGRTPDMSPPAANAFLAVLQEVGSGQGLAEKKEAEPSGAHATRMAHVTHATRVEHVTHVTHATHVTRVTPSHHSALAPPCPRATLPSRH